MVRGIESSLSDAKGITVWTIKAESAVLGNEKGAVVGSLNNGTATMYENGEPTATMKADTLTADKEKRTVVGRGHVFAKSLLPQDKGRILQADTIRWDIQKHLLRGEGNVILTQEPDTVVHADSFSANLKLRNIELQQLAGKSGISF